LIVLVGLVMAAHLLLNCVPWDELRILKERVKLPQVAFLTTPTVTPTFTPDRTLTFILTPSPTPTLTEVLLLPTDMPTALPPTATQAPKPTSTPTFSFPAPHLLAPEDRAEFRGGGARIELSWEPVGTLSEDEWYAVSLRFTADGIGHYSGTWTKEKSWRVPRDLRVQAGHAERAFQWDVTVMRQTDTKPGGGRKGVPQSALGETRTFMWY